MTYSSYAYRKLVLLAWARRPGSGMGTSKPWLVLSFWVSKVGPRVT